MREGCRLRYARGHELTVRAGLLPQDKAPVVQNLEAITEALILRGVG